MKKKAILVLSFGTSFAETRAKNIEKMESEVAENYPDYEIFTAFTSGMIRKALKKQGIHRYSLEEALEEMKTQNISEVFILPTHLLHGFEYDKIKEEVLNFSKEFEKLELASPLLSDTEVMLDIVKILEQNNPVSPETALVLVGHGTEHFSNAVYPALDYMAKQQGFSHVFFCTIEGYPDVSTMIPMLKNSDYREIKLLPFMLVAGDHAKNDIASQEEDSIKSLLEKEGFSVSVLLKGLGEYPEIRNIYRKHLEKILK